MVHCTFSTITRWAGKKRCLEKNIHKQNFWKSYKPNILLSNIPELSTIIMKEKTKNKMAPSRIIKRKKV